MPISSYTDPDLVFSAAGVFVRWLRIVTTGLSPHLHVLHGLLGVRGGRGYLIQLLLEHLLGLFLIFLRKTIYTALIHTEMVKMILYMTYPQMYTFSY